MNNFKEIKAVNETRERAHKTATGTEAKKLPGQDIIRIFIIFRGGQGGNVRKVPNSGEIQSKSNQF
jgi:hypothetical protein